MIVRRDTLIWVLHGLSIRKLMIVHSWILKILELVQVSENTVQLIRKSVKTGTQS